MNINKNTMFSSSSFIGPADAKINYTTYCPLIHSPQIKTRCLSLQASKTTYKINKEYNKTVFTKNKFQVCQANLLTKVLLREVSSSFFLNRFPLVQKYFYTHIFIKSLPWKSSPMHLQLFCIYINIYKDIINSTHCYNKIYVLTFVSQTMTAKGNQEIIKLEN